MTSVSIPNDAVMTGNNAYFLDGTDINWYRRNPDGQWEIVLTSVSMCWGCFGDHSFTSGQCWGVLCQCCGGTGWEGKNMEFCASASLSNRLPVCLDTQFPQTALLHFLASHKSDLGSIRNDKVSQITPALVRGNTAKFEIFGEQSRYMGLLERKVERGWCLEALTAICKICNGTGHTQDETAFCPACAGLKWGELGELHYGFNDAPGWWTLVGESVYY